MNRRNFITGILGAAGATIVGPLAPATESIETLTPEESSSLKDYHLDGEVSYGEPIRFEDVKFSEYSYELPWFDYEENKQ